MKKADFTFKNIRHLLLFFGIICIPTASIAQHKKSGDTIQLHKVKYPNGKLSAYSWLLESTGYGRATCWDKKGAIIFDTEITRNHGHHSVYFEHHPNKVVSKIEESSAPDAGIQWYNSTYYYDENGVKTGESHSSHDDLLRISLPDEREVQPVYVVPSPPIIYNNEIWFINQTAFTLVTSYKIGNEIHSDTLHSGDTLLMGNITQHKGFENPSKVATFHAVPMKKTKRSSKWSFIFLASGDEKGDDTRKRYYYSIGQQLIPPKK